MSCGRNVRAEMLSMAIFCVAINDVLMDFYEGQSHANLWVRIRGAINFLGYYSERSPELRKRGGWDLPKYGFKDDIYELTYEQLVATQRFLKEHEKRLLQTKKKLPMILDLKLSPEKRRAVAWYCVKLFSGLCDRYLYYSNYPPNFGIPKGILEPRKPERKKK